MINRLKDEEPLKTVIRIRTILNTLGIFTVEHWNANGVSGLFSVRIVIVGTNIGTNGKGVSEPLALASGYGEFMERLQNGLLLAGYVDGYNLRAVGGRDIPVRHLLDHSPLVDGVLYAMKSVQENEKEGLGSWPEISWPDQEKSKRLGLWNVPLSGEGCGDNKTVSCAEYIEIATGEKAYLPLKMLPAFGSHGMAAGNTYKEAVVQGLSEIFERYCQKRILEEKLCPPEIALDELAARFPTILAYKKQIEEHSELSVQIRDCSLGKGYPVYCICIANKDTHCFSVTFGSHPNPAVAFERLFTEVFQGRSLKDISNRICEEPLPEPYNTKGLFKNSMGHYPMEFWAGRDSYCVDERLLAQGFENNDLAYDYCLEVCKRNRMRVFIRDAGFLGFPAVHIICPGFSEVLCWNEFVLRHNSTSKHVKELILKYDALEESEKRLILEFVDFDRKVGLAANTRPYECLKFVFGTEVLSPIEVVTLFLAKVACDLGCHKRAANYVAKLKSASGFKTEVFSSTEELLRLSADGCGPTDALCILKRFYRDNVLAMAEEIIRLPTSKLIDVSELRSVKSGLKPMAIELYNRSQSFNADCGGLCRC